MAKNHFDGHEFTLRFPTIDDIVQTILSVENDPVLYKIDVARAFRNLKVDPVDALKLGIQWDGMYFLDQSVAFGWTHGSAAFQMVSDAVTFIMQQHGAKVFAYIDDYIGISEACDARRHFDDLHALLLRLGLPINQQKLSPPSKTLICLGVQIDIPKASLSIDHEKLLSIHKECFHIAGKNTFQGKISSPYWASSFTYTSVWYLLGFLSTECWNFSQQQSQEEDLPFYKFFPGLSMVREIFAPF